MSALFGLAILSGAVALSKKRGLAGPTGDAVCHAAWELSTLLDEWHLDGTIQELPNPVSPKLPGVVGIAIRARNREEMCAKANSHFHKLFNRTFELEKALGATYSGDIIDRKLITSRVKSSEMCKSAKVTPDDVEFLLEEAHELQADFLHLGGRHGCHGRAT